MRNRGAADKAPGLKPWSLNGIIAGAMVVPVESKSDIDIAANLLSEIPVENPKGVSLMSQTVNSLLKLSAAAASLSFLVGCASQASDSMMGSDSMSAIEEAQATAAEANAKAEAAMQSANEAKEMAQEAGGLAQSAQYTADQNSQKVDRMFKKSMYK